MLLPSSMDRRWTHASVLAVAVVLLFGTHARAIEIQLEPGEGTILLLGQDKDMAAVKAKYFAPDAPAVEGPLDCLLLGFYAGAERIADSADYVDRTLATYKAAGATTVWAYHGNMQGGKESPASRFAALGAKHGLKVILQPNDVYFRGSNYWSVDGYDFVKKYKDPADFMAQYLMPRLKEWAPGVRDDSNILAWGPSEELPAEDELVYVEYKKAFKELLPKHLFYQLDSQQAFFERLRHKWRPYPDIVAFDRYPWWDREEGLWTPEYAVRLLYSWLKEYPGAAYELLDGAPAVFVAQGCAEMYWIGEKDGTAKGWLARDGFRVPKSPSISWRPEVGQFLEWNRYLAPTNAWRLQSWLGICAGFKGLSFWSAGPDGGPDDLKKALREATGIRVCLIDNDMRGLPYLKEVSDSWKEIRRFEKLILRLHPAHICAQYTIGGQKILANTFRDKEGDSYLIVVNGDIVTYDGTNPVWLNWPQTTLSVNDQGELINYIPLKDKRSIRVEARDPDTQVYDLKQALVEK